jgi:2-polyprenyl-3-methyl-5-hydroxy-6-metoxy-1,4-benzoquinol methylase
MPGRWVTGTVLQLPFKNCAFDVVISSQMLHHINSDQELIRVFSEASRVASKLVLLSDLHRNAVLYGLLSVILRIGMFPRTFREDGLLSVRRGFRVDEWRRFAAEAKMPQAQTWLYFGARIMLASRKEICSG